MLGNNNSVEPEIVLNEQEAFDKLSKASLKIQESLDQKQNLQQQAEVERIREREEQLRIQAEKIKQFEESKVSNRVYRR